MINYLVDGLLLINQLFFNQLGITLIFIGVAVRVVFYPIIKQQLSHSQKIRELQPQMNALKKKYGDDKVKLAEAQNELFKEAGVNPLAGCLPLIVQLVIFSVLYNAISQVFSRGVPTNFLFFDLKEPDVHNLFGLPFGVPGILAILASLTQFILSKMMLPEPVGIKANDDPKEKAEKADFMQDFAEMQSSMIWMFPLVFLFMASKFPSGLALYWTSSTIMAIFQQWQFAGPGSLAPWLKKIGISPKSK